MLDDILALRKEFAEEAVRYPSANSYLGYIEKGTVLHFCGPGPCHGALSRGSFTKNRIPTHILSYVQRPHEGVTKSLHRFYQNWLVNESPWESIFLDKDVDQILKMGHVVDPTLPNDLVISGLIASRFTTESYNGGQAYQRRYDVYEELLKVCNPTEAFLFMHLFGKVDYKLYPMKMAPLGSDHLAFNLTQSKKSVFKNFLEGGYKNNAISFVDNQGYEAGVYKTFGEVDPKSSFFKDVLMSIRPKSQKAAKSLSIFVEVSKAKKGWLILDREDLVGVIKEIKEQLKA